MPFMNILTNALLLNDQFSGMQYSTELLLQAISNLGTPFPDGNQIQVLISKDYTGNLKTNDNLNIKKLSFSTVNRLKRIHFENFTLPGYFAKNKFNVYHSTSNLLPYFSNIPSILTVHDLVPVDYPRYVRAETLMYYKLCLGRSIYKANKIIAVSNKVKEDIIRRFNIDKNKIQVIYHGVESQFRKVVCKDKLAAVTKKYDLPGCFLLFVGNLEPRKNLVRLLEAFIYLKRHFRIDHKLVIVGKKGWKYEDIFREQRFEHIKGQILFTGYVERNDLPSIYSLCDLFVFPSVYEGFGLPVVEAMACEAPVLISNEGALPEVTGNIYPRADAFDVKDIAFKIHMLLKDRELRKHNIEHGTERARFFTWEKTANETLEVYNTLAKKRMALRS
jgi:glycosyltransferase involved in cell wall biosynthesis